ncbi:MAG TPA: 4-alpha-glucanotransferase, partial [Ohtaekwangia sp.]
AIWDILHNIRQIRPGLEAAADALADVLLVKPQKNDPEYNKRALQFYMRCMQFTGPLMAKGVEDTLMYTYNRFIGHNEVGDSPVFFGITTDDFHERMIDRQKHWPFAMNTTSTHDTKRGEDVRTRLNVLPELADEWIEQVHTWRQLNAGNKTDNAPDSNDEYFIYQTLAGAYPLEGDDNIGDRLDEYITKSLREAKRHSDWASPNEAYEQATIHFTKQLLNRKNPFWRSFEKFHQRIADVGIINSLSQLILKFTCPGVPDVYQGCELWDFSLVDPDNRRPVDFDLRNSELENLQQEASWNDLWTSRNNAEIKLWMTHQLLQQRKQFSELFLKGTYIPLTIEGDYRDHVMAFARRHQRQWHITVVPLQIGVLSKHQKKDVVNIRWRNTRIILPGEAPSHWVDALSPDKKGDHSGSIAVSDVFSPLPFALLTLEKSVQERSAGILMHITSLPSRYGIGDLGPQAYAFADFLYRCNQSYWQLLPINPVEVGDSPSPYSSFSAMAGNELLISPELLATENLLSEDEVHEYSLPLENEVDYLKSRQIKEVLFEKAWQSFQLQGDSPLKNDFQKFIAQESYWLNDYALYVELKRHYNLQSWGDWDVEYRNRHPDALKWFSSEHEAALQKTKWLQFIFFRQWKKLKAYAESVSLKLVGDLPFYMSYDSVDVWANPEIFSLDDQHKVKGVAGVPPDYFNADGQLWGMPVYCWDKLETTGYDWWIRRIRKNLELFDVIRLDHFRAFAGYWEVPASETTAVNGKWQTGPSSKFFHAMKATFGELPFIAEDLGEITDDVYQLRDEFNLPGMKVLQFAFSNDISKSMYAPHQYANTNFIVYTGTHDNNTTRGWYRMDLDKKQRTRISEYVGCGVNEQNINTVLLRLAYASTAKAVIAPMQDILGLDEHARMNKPGTVKSNWKWRVSPRYDSPILEEQLRHWTNLYGRSC